MGHLKLHALKNVNPYFLTLKTVKINGMKIIKLVIDTTVQIAIHIIKRNWIIFNPDK